MKVQSMLVLFAVMFGVSAYAANKEVVWPASDIQFKPVMEGITKAELWGNSEKGAHGTLTKFAAGKTVALHTHSKEVKLVVVAGTIVHGDAAGKETNLGVGSYLFVPANAKHTTACTAEAECLFFEEQPGKFDLKMVNAGKSAAKEKTTEETTN